MNEMASKRDSHQINTPYASEDRSLIKNTYEGQDLINELPLELLQEIFSYLNENIKALLQLAGTCRQWRVLNLESSAMLVKLFSKKIPKASQQYHNGLIDREAFLYEAILEARIRSEKIAPHVTKIKGHLGPIACIRPFGEKYFVTVGYDDSQLILWDIEKNIPLQTKRLNEMLPNGAKVIATGLEVCGGKIIIDTAYSGMYIWNVEANTLLQKRIKVHACSPYGENLIIARDNSVYWVDLNNLDNIKELFQTDEDIAYLWIHNKQFFILKQSELEVRNFENTLIKKTAIDFPINYVKKNENKVIMGTNDNKPSIKIWDLESDSLFLDSECLVFKSVLNEDIEIESWGNKFLLFRKRDQESKIQILDEEGQIIKIIDGFESHFVVTGMKGKVILGNANGGISILDYNLYKLKI